MERNVDLNSAPDWSVERTDSRGEGAVLGDWQVAGLYFCCVGMGDARYLFSSSGLDGAVYAMDSKRHMVPILHIDMALSADDANYAVMRNGARTGLPNSAAFCHVPGLVAVVDHSGVLWVARSMTSSFCLVGARQYLFTKCLVALNKTIFALTEDGVVISLNGDGPGRFIADMEPVCAMFCSDQHVLLQCKDGALLRVSETLLVWRFDAGCGIGPLLGPDVGVVDSVLFENNWAIVCAANVLWCLFEGCRAGRDWARISLQWNLYQIALLPQRSHHCRDSFVAVDDKGSIYTWTSLEMLCARATSLPLVPSVFAPMDGKHVLSIHASCYAILFTLADRSVMAFRAHSITGQLEQIPGLEWISIAAVAAAGPGTGRDLGRCRE